MSRKCYIILILCLISLEDVVNSAKQNRTKIVIDNDAGGDDAMAIFVALLCEKYLNGPQLVGLTTGNGNTAEDNVYVNNQRILKVAERQDVPIYRGATCSLVKTPITNAYYGEDGLGDTEDYHGDLVPAQPKGAVSALIDLSKQYKDELTVITIGTLTNVAMAVKLDPHFIQRVGHLYVGAGHIHDEQTPNAEFNALMDVEAYNIIAQNANPDKVTLLPFSQVKSSLNITNTWREEVLGKIDSDIVKAQNKFENVSMERQKQFGVWHALDPAVVAVAVRPDLVEEYKYSKNDIITCGEHRGKNTNSIVGKDDANVRVVYSIKHEQYKQFLMEVFSQGV